LTTHQAHAKDPSTLSSLHPAQPKELHYRGAKNSTRLHGSHFMTLRRPSKMPESGREYVAGDPVNLIDWKAYARSDKLIIREIRDEATARILIGLDLSETMIWPTEKFGGLQPPTKAEVATRLALNLAHVHLRMGDLVEIWAVTDPHTRVPSLVTKPRSPSDVVTGFNRMHHAGFGIEAIISEFGPAEPEDRPRDCAFWIGDTLSNADFGNFLARGRRAFLLHTLSSLELQIDWIENDTSYFDEGMGKKEYQGQVLRNRDNYVKHLANWRAKLERRMHKSGGEYLTVSDQTAIAQYHMTLSQFLASARTG
jgi:hypothetical protein